MNNLTILKGNLGKEPEIRTTASNTKVAIFSIGVYRANSKDKDKPFTDWFNCIAWGELADLVETKLKKGMTVQVIGRFKTRNYDDKDGKRVYVTELWADDIAIVLKKDKDDTSTVTDEDLPF